MAKLTRFHNYRSRRIERIYNLFLSKTKQNLMAIYADGCDNFFFSIHYFVEYNCSYSEECNFFSSDSTTILRCCYKLFSLTLLAFESKFLMICGRSYSYDYTWLSKRLGNLNWSVFYKYQNYVVVQINRNGK